MDVAALSVLPVGIVAWRQPEPAMTVIVKATFSLARDGEAALAAVQEPLGLDEPYPEPDASELRAASDFAPLKARAELLVVGHVHGPSPARQLAGRVAVDQLERCFAAVAPEPCAALPLTTRYLRPGGGDVTTLRVGPRAAPAGPWWGHHAGEPFDFSLFNVAPAAQQLDRLRPSAVLELENLVAGAEYRKARLPGLRPTCFCVSGREAGHRTAPRPEAAREVALRCDTLVIDTDRAICTLSWRGVVVLGAAPDSSAYLVVAVAQEGAPLTFVELAADLAAARWVRAVDAHSPLVPPAWVRPAAGVCPLPSAAKVYRAPARHHASPAATLVTRTAVTTARPAERFPFLPGPDHDDERTEPPTVIRDESPLGRGSTGVIDRDALLAARALPFEAARDRPAPNDGSGGASPPRGLGMQLGVSKLGGSNGGPNESPALTDETTRVGPRPAPRVGQQTLLVDPASGARGDGLPFTRAIVDESFAASRAGAGEARPTLPRTVPLPVFAGPVQPTTPDAAGSAYRPWSAPPPGPEPVGPPGAAVPGVPPLGRLPAPPPAPRAAAGPPGRQPPVAVAPALAHGAEAAHTSAAPAPSGRLTLPTYARIKAEMWCSPHAMGEILERFGIDEALWQTYERRQEQTLADEASRGRSELAAELREALGRARAELGVDEVPTLTIEQYVELRVEVDSATDARAVLQARGLSADQWHRLRRGWHERSLADPALARELRAKLAAVRRARQP